MNSFTVMYINREFVLANGVPIMDPITDILEEYNIKAVDSLKSFNLNKLNKGEVD